MRQLNAKHGEEEIPAALHGRHEAAVIYNNLASLPSTTFKYPTAENDKAWLALKIDVTVRENAPAGWHGDDAKEAQVVNALFPILERDREATKAVFEIVKNQPGYQ